jgi:uncharacterized protein YlxW (UPF0749 family)
MADQPNDSASHDEGAAVDARVEGHAVGGSSRPDWRAILLRRPSRGQWIVGVLCALLGFGIVLQVRTVNNDQTLSSARPEDLIRVLEALDARSDRLDAQIDDLAATRDRLANARDKDAAAAAERAARQRDTAVLAGTIGATGPGVELAFTGPVDAGLMLDTIQELRDAGAEAIQIGPARVIASTSVQPGTATGEILVGDSPVRAPITVRAIGNSSTMASALRIPGGVADTAIADGVTLTIDPRDRITIDAVVPLASPEAATPAP